MHAGNGFKDVILIGLQLTLGLQLVGKHVEQHLGVRVGVDMTQVGFEKLFAELVRVGQVAVVGQGNTVGRVHIERLGERRARAARRRIAHVADTDIAHQPLHMTGPENVFHQAVGLLLSQLAAVTGHDTRRILAAMLEYGQRVIELQIDIAFTHNTHNAAHRKTTFTS